MIKTQQQKHCRRKSGEHIDACATLADGTLKHVHGNVAAGQSSTQKQVKKKAFIFSAAVMSHPARRRREHEDTSRKASRGWWEGGGGQAVRGLNGSTQRSITPRTNANSGTEQLKRIWLEPPSQSSVSVMTFRGAAGKAGKEIIPALLFL